MSHFHPKPSDPASELTASAADAATIMGSAPAIPGALREGPGTKIGPYRLLQLIGEGGFGSVFMAEQERPVQRKVALKIIKLGMDTHQVVARFEQERQALAILDHPNIAKVFDAGATDTGRPYFVMELCNGEPIDSYCDKNNLSIPERLELFAQVCQAVQHAHTKGIIHRDIKPSNVLVSAQDGKPSAKVIDFGIAKATASRLTEKTVFTEHKQIIGTPEYMSPEQAEGSLDIDTRTDVYALGVMLYELLTGSTPFNGQELRSAAYAEIQRIIREVEPPKPSTRLSQNTDTIASVAARRKTEPKRLGTIIRGELDWIVMKALEKERTRRYETANGLMMDIQRYLGGEAVVAAPPGTGYRLRKFVKRNRGRVAAGGIVVGALVLATGVSVWFAVSEASARRRESVQRAEAVKQQGIAQANAQAEAKARKQAQTINQFVITALKAGDAQNVGGGENMTILAAMDNAIKDIDSGRFKDDPATQAALESTIGTILQNNGQLRRAEPIFAAALRTRQRLYKSDHPDVASAMNNLGLVREDLGKVEEAEQILKDALEMTRRLYPGDHPDVEESLDNLAMVRQHLGRLDEAEPLLVEAQAMRQRLYKGDHPSVATGLNNLASLREALGRADEAEPLYIEALAMRQRLFAGDHPMVAGSLNNLAHVRQTLGRLSEAEPLYAQAIDMWRRLYKGDSPDLAKGLQNLAIVLRDLSRPAEAEPVFVEALEMNRRLYRTDHASIATAQTNLARARQALGKTALARADFDGAVAMFRRMSPDGSPSLARVLWRSGGAHLENKEFAQARPELEEAVKMAEKLLPPEHPQLKEYREALARCMAGLAEQGKPAAK